MNKENISFKLNYTNRRKPAPITSVTDPAARNKPAEKACICSYAEPDRKDMAILLVYFNPCNYNRIKQNALTVKHQLDSANIPYFIAEIQHDTSIIPFLFRPSDNVFQYSSDCYIFYKENLIATMVPRIPAQYTKLCIVDFDILFVNPDWYSIVSAKLDTVDVTQPFTQAHYLNLDFTICITKTNCVDNRVAKTIDCLKDHTGFAWAFRREWFRTFPLDDKMISPMGDTILACNITKRDRDNHCIQRYLAFSGETIWEQEVDYDSCDLTIYHMSHGTFRSRQYISIRKTLDQAIAKMGVPNSAALFQRRADHILEWAPAYKSAMNDILWNYFKTREDDIVE